MHIMQTMQGYKIMQIMHFMQVMQNMQGYKTMQIMHFMQGAGAGGFRMGRCMV